MTLHALHKNSTFNCENPASQIETNSSWTLLNSPWIHKSAVTTSKTTWKTYINLLQPPYQKLHGRDCLSCLNGMKKDRTTPQLTYLRLSSGLCPHPPFSPIAKTPDRSRSERDTTEQEEQASVCACAREIYIRRGRVRWGREVERESTSPPPVSTPLYPMDRAAATAIDIIVMIPSAPSPL
jgi:hypothetical protein